MKLKKVSIQFEYVIVVDDDGDAEEVARDTAEEAMRDLSRYSLDIIVTPYRSGSVSEWDEGTIPYGGDGNMTTGQIEDAAL